MEKLLSVTEAAFKLGITKELLFAYIRNAPKKHLGHQRKLVSVVKGGQNFFKENELTEFDDYLKDPWSNPNERRPIIPSFIQDYLKVEIGGKCPISQKGYPLENAHIIPYNESLSHHHHNLIRISKEEHTKIDNGIIPRSLLPISKNKLIESLRAKLKLEDNNYQSSFSLPKPHPTFIGRFFELFELTEAMENERLIIIEGLGGIGKTQLLLNAFENVQYHNPVLWIDVEAIGSLRDLLLILNNGISQYIEIAEESMIDSLKNIPITFVFDSLEKLLISERDEIEDFIKTIVTKTNSCQILITSQIDLSILDHSKKVMRLNGLDNHYSFELFTDLLEEDIEMSNDNKQWILDFCDGHPLCLKLIVSIIKFHNNVNRAISQLKDAGIPKNPIRKIHSKTTALDVCLSTIYNTLSEEQNKIIHYIKYFPAGLKLNWAEQHFSQTDFIENLAILRQFFFVDIVKDQLDFERITITNPIRIFLKEEAKIKSAVIEEELNIEAISEIMIEAIIIDSHYIENGIYGSPAYGIRRIEDELPNILEAFRVSKEKSFFYEKKGNDTLKEKYLNFIVGIAGALGKFCWARGYFEYGTIISRAGIDANLKLKNYEIASTQYMYLGQIQQRQLDKKGFSQTVDNLKTLAEKTNCIEIKIDAAWANGRLELDRHNFIEALKLFNEAKELINTVIKNYKQPKTTQEFSKKVFEEYGQSHHLGNLSLIVSEIAKVYEFSGNFSEAANNYQAAIKTHKEFNDETNLMACYYHYANCLVKLNKTNNAIDYYLKAVEGFKVNGQFEYLFNTISSLGIIIEDNLSILDSEHLDEETFVEIVKNLNYSFQNFINQELKDNDLNTVTKKIPYKLLSQLICVIKIIGFTSHRFIMTEWIIEFGQKFNVKNIEFGYFTATLNLGHAIGAVDEWRDIEENKTLMIKTILQSCVIINGGPDLKSKTRIFYWLEKWMQHTKLDATATAENLWDQAWATFDDND
jgi:tetratricopeptide (TPR) repeat protein